MPSQGCAELYEVRVDRTSGTPLSRQIYKEIRLAVLSGVLAPETKLPATRMMAAKLKVARASVVAAYEQLLAEGYVEGRPGSGTFVSTDFADYGESSRLRPVRRVVRSRPLPDPAKAFVEFERPTAQTESQPFNTGRTSVDARTAEIWRMLTRKAARSLESCDLGYTDPCGLIELRRTICDYLRVARGVRCDPDQIVITAGAQHAIDIAIRVLLAPGDEVWIEDPGYPLTHALLSLAKARPRPIPVDAQGIVVDRGRRTAPLARAAFVTPSHQFPMGFVLSMARRLELLAWARASDAFIIEDDYTSEFRYSGPPLASLQGLDEDARVLYVGTLNKALFPGLRIGYAVVPHTLLPAFANARYLMDRQPPTFWQKVVAAFMEQGHFAAHVRRTRQMYREQRDALATALVRHAAAHLEVAVPDQGMHLVAYLNDGISDIKIERAAMRAGITVRATSRFYRSASPRPGLMLGFSGFSPRQIAPAAERLAAVVASALPTASAVASHQPR